MRCELEPSSRDGPDYELLADLGEAARTSAGIGPALTSWWHKIGVKLCSHSTTGPRALGLNLSKNLRAPLA